MRVEVFQPYHLQLMSVQRRQLSQVPASFASFQKPVGPAFTAFDGDSVLLCGGIATADKRLGVLWALLSEDAGKHMLWLHRATTRFIGTVSIRRIEATVEKGFPEGCRWLKLLGFKYEGQMPGYGENGETHLRFGRVV